MTTESMLTGVSNIPAGGGDAGKASAFLNPSITSVPEITVPKTECLSFNPDVSASVMKNWEPPVFGRLDLAIESLYWDEWRRSGWYSSRME